MQNRAKERKLRRAVPEIRIGDDIESGLDKLGGFHSELRTLRLCKIRAAHVRQKAQAQKSKLALKCIAKIVQAIPKISEEVRQLASEIINGRRFVSVGSGRGPTLPDEPSASEIRAQVAAEANALWGRNDVTPRMLQSAYALKLTDEDLMLSYLTEHEAKLKNYKK